MKTILIAALIGLISVNSYAQNRCNGMAKSKVVHHEAVKVVHYGIAPQNDAQTNLPDYITVLAPVPNTYVAVPPAPEACSVYRHNNIVVKECPGTFYNNTGNIRFDGEGVWLGYYPDNEAVNDGNVNSDIAPQHTVISNQKGGVAPADGNSCNDCTPQ